MVESALKFKGTGDGPLPLCYSVGIFRGDTVKSQFVLLHVDCFHLVSLDLREHVTILALLFVWRSFDIDRHSHTGVVNCVLITEVLNIYV